MPKYYLTCEGCYWSDQCESDTRCEDYVPCGDEAVDAEIDEFIEMRRAVFREEWFEYLAENE